MNDSKIVKVVDALMTQRRVILWLDCSHTISISATAWYETPRHLYPELGEVVQCKFCPDSPPRPKIEEKTPQQLWREAGEP